LAGCGGAARPPTLGWMVTVVRLTAPQEGRALEDVASVDGSPGGQRRVSTVAAYHLLSQEIDGEMVLLDLRSGMYLGLNGVGTFVWKLISSRESPVGVGEIVEAVAAEFDVAAATARRDLDQLLEDLSSNHLVHIVV
jgi:hypothetical protein